MLAAAAPFKLEEPLPTLRFGDLALTSTRISSHFSLFIRFTGLPVGRITSLL